MRNAIYLLLAGLVVDGALFVACNWKVHHDPTWAELHLIPFYKKLPITVSAGPDIDRDSLDWAIKMYEKDCNLFEIAGPEGGTIHVAYDNEKGEMLDSEERPSGGATFMDASTGKVFIEVYAPPMGFQHNFIIAHELGRALGLGADYDQSSIMADFGAFIDWECIRAGCYQERPRLEAFPMPVLMTADREAIKKRYCEDYIWEGTAPL